MIGGRQVVEAHVDHGEYEDEETEEDEHVLHPVVHGALHPRALQRAARGGVAAESRLVPRVDDQSHDPVRVLQSGASLEKLVGAEQNGVLLSVTPQLAFEEVEIRAGW